VQICILSTTVSLPMLYAAIMRCLRWGKDMALSCVILPSDIWQAAWNCQGRGHLNL